VGIVGEISKLSLFFFLSKNNVFSLNMWKDAWELASPLLTELLLLLSSDQIFLAVFQENVSKLEFKYNA